MRSASTARSTKGRTIGVAKRPPGTTTWTGKAGGSNLARIRSRRPARTYASTCEGVLGLSGALARGRLGARLREQIALAVSQANGCDYCLSAHSALGKGLHLSDAALALARRGRASDPRDEAALRFAKRVVEWRGQVSDADLGEVRRAGYDDGQIVELVANAVLNVFTNYLNQVAETEIDFPVVRAGEARGGLTRGGEGSGRLRSRRPEARATGMRRQWSASSGLGARCSRSCSSRASRSYRAWDSRRG